MRLGGGLMGVRNRLGEGGDGGGDVGGDVGGRSGYDFGILTPLTSGRLLVGSMSRCLTTWRIRGSFLFRRRVFSVLAMAPLVPACCRPRCIQLL